MLGWPSCRAGLGPQVEVPSRVASEGSSPTAGASRLQSLFKENVQSWVLLGGGCAGVGGACPGTPSPAEMVHCQDQVPRG